MTLLDLHRRAELDLVAGDRRATGETGHLRVDLELVEHLRERRDHGVVGLRARLVGRARAQQVGGRQVVGDVAGERELLDPGGHRLQELGRSGLARDDGAFLGPLGLGRGDDRRTASAGQHRGVEGLLGVVVGERTHPTARTPERLTLAINTAVERQVRASPADWFWVHNRWKTPRPRFLLATYKRGIVPGVEPTALKPFRVVVRSPNWLGDAVMSIAAVQAIAAGRPDARVSVLCPGKLADLWRRVPGVAEVLSIGERDRLLGAARTVRRAGPFDAAVLLPNSVRVALEVWLAGVPRRVGYPGHRRRWLLDQVLPELPPPGHGHARHHRDRYLEMAKQIGADITGWPAPAQLPPAPPADGDPRPRFALCPGAEYGPAKRWGTERFAATARAVAAGQPCRWVLLGTAKDRELGVALEAELGADLCENLIGKTTLTGLIETLEGCQLLLSNDTGTMHLAAWLGVPTVAVFGSTEPRLTGPIASDPTPGACSAPAGGVFTVFPAQLSAGPPLHGGDQRRGDGGSRAGLGGQALMILPPQTGRQQAPTLLTQTRADHAGRATRSDHRGRIPPPVSRARPRSE